MCQCVVCDCWWMNCCGECGFGCTEQLCCIGYWCCQPDSIPPEGKKCCFCCDRVGCGGGVCCVGGICFSPEWLVKWSNSLKK